MTASLTQSRRRCPQVTARQLDLVLAAYRAMLTGKPAEVTVIAAGAGWNTNEAAVQLRDWRGVYCDENGRVSGFWGERWTSEHPGTTALPLAEAAAIGRSSAERLRRSASSLVA